VEVREGLAYCDKYGNLVLAPVAEWATGVDIGQERDFCAVVVLEMRKEPISAETCNATGTMVRTLGEPKYHLRLCKRMRLGTGYDAILLALKNLRQTFPQLANAEFWIDMTGNRGLKKMAEMMNVVVTPVQIVPGNSNHTKYDPSTGFRNISKSRLVNELQAASACGDLILPPRGASADADQLRAELQNFAMSLTPSGATTFNASVGHDDLVCAAALALAAVKGETGNRIRVQTFGI
jgi:hypothetical protein